VAVAVAVASELSQFINLIPFLWVIGRKGRRELNL
jgi:hypothetical protein